MAKRRPSKKRPIEIKEFHTPSSGIFFMAARRILSERTPFQKMEVYETASFGRVLLLDGLVQTTERDEFFYHEMLVHPAMMAHPNPREILIIGGGDGGALREVLRYPVKKATLAEIDAAVIAAAKSYFPTLAASFRDRRAEILITDGNRFVRESGGRYDVILVDSSDPVGPSAVLHQRDFFSRLRERLKPEGAIAAQAGSPLFHLEHLKTKSGFLKKLFKYSAYYLGPAPTYPGGYWCYAFLSDSVNPLRPLRRKPPEGLKYYNHEIHAAAFSLPEFMGRANEKRKDREMIR
jgi:spermidine synthase